MEFKRLKEVLERYGQLLVTKYQSYVPEASGKLVQSVRYELNYGENSYEVGLWLEDYWKYVEHGRKAGKFPPLSKIEEWIKVKPVIPRPYNGILPTEKQLAFLIGRKIAQEGIEPKNVLKRTEDEVRDDMIMSIKQAIMEDIQEDINTVLVTLTNRK